MPINVDNGVSNTTNNREQGEDSLGLKDAREKLFGSQATHKDSKEGMDADVRSGLKGPATWISQKAGYDPRNNNSNGDSGLSAVGSPMSKPIGTMVTEESRLTGKRYADRPEGVDQFGGEESERQKEEPRSSGTGVSEAELKRYKDRPEGLDQFGGEEAERKL